MNTSLINFPDFVKVGLMAVIFLALFRLFVSKVSSTTGGQ